MSEDGSQNLFVLLVGDFCSSFFVVEVGNDLLFYKLDQFSLIVEDFTSDFDLLAGQ